MAGFLGVSLPTVVNWIKAGRMVCHKTPGGHRRIARADLIAFAREADMPLPPEVLDPDPARRKRVLIIDDDVDFAEVVGAFLRARGQLDVSSAGTAFDAGLGVGRFRPDLLLIDLDMPDVDAMELRRRLQEDEELRAIPVVACAPAPGGPAQRDRILGSFDGLVEKPLELDPLLHKIQRHLGVRS